jgi:hypothetical protein
LLVRRKRMTEDMSRRFPTDMSRINIHEDLDVSYWTAKWDVTRAELTDAISRVGAAADAVADELGRAHA